MYGLSTDVVKPGCHYCDLIQHRKDTGSFDGDVRDFCDPIMRNVSQGKINSTHHGDRRRALLSDRQQAAGAGRMGRDHRGHHRAPQARAGARPQPRLPARDHRPHPVADHGEGRARPPLRAGQPRWPRSSSAPRARRSSARRRSSCSRRRSPSRSPPTTTGRCNPRETLFIDEHRWESRTLGTRFITSKRLAIRDEAGEPRYLINVVEDVTERRRADEKIAHLAHYDALTDLPNRVLFREQIERELQKAGRGEQFALLYIDIDEFKGINDSLGHHVGDELLKTVASRISGCISQTDLIARLGGDEFAVIQTGVGSVADVESSSADLRGDPAALSVPRPSAVDRRLDRHRAGAAGRHRSRPADQERRPCDVCRQGRRPPHPPLLRAGHGRQRQGAPHHGAGSAAGAGRWRLRDPLPAAARSRQRRGHRLRGAAALAPSRTRHDLAGRIHSGRRGYRPDQRARRLGAAHRLRRGRDLARSHPPCGQRLAGAAEVPDAGAADRRRARRLRPAGRAGSRSRSPRPC